MTSRLSYQRDSNSEITWGSRDDGSLSPFGRNGKTLGLLHGLASRGLEICAPGLGQLQTPTTQPRQEGRVGKQIDFLACARIRHSALTIVTGSHAVVGTDHDVLRMPVNLQRVSRLLRTDTRPRKLKKPLGPVTAVNQETLVNLAATHTGPAQGKGYADPADVKALFTLMRMLTLMVAYTSTCRAYTSRRSE